MQLSHVRKALIAGVGAAGASLTQAVQSHGQITANDALVALGAALLVGYAAYRVPNAPKQ